MKKTFSLIIILILLFSLSVPLSAEKLPDGSKVPEDILYYASFLYTDTVFECFSYNIGTTKADDIYEATKLELAALMFMNPHDKGWVDEYTSYDTMIGDLNDARGYNIDRVEEVEFYILPVELVQSKYSLFFGNDVILSDESYHYMLVGQYECDFIRTSINGEDVYLYYVTEFMGGGDNLTIENKLIYDYEYIDDELLIYVGYHRAGSDSEELDINEAKVWFYADTEKKLKFATYPYKEFSEYLDKRYYDESLYEEKYYAQYLHTFKSNGKGGYYWYSTELIGVGGKPVDEVIPSTDDATIRYPTLAVCSMLVMVGTLTTKKRTKT